MWRDSIVQCLSAANVYQVAFSVFDYADEIFLITT